MELPQSIDAVVVGAGWAGLAVSWQLQRAGVDHVVLERGRIGETWRTQRWDSFLMNLPNFAALMPGESYTGDEPDGFLTRDAYVAQLEAYAGRNGLPVLAGVDVRELRMDQGRFHVVSDAGEITARAVVVATGSLNQPVRPALASAVSADILQLDASSYRAAEHLPAGAVLVVGAAQSGGQIAEDLALAGRKTYLSTGRVGRMRRRYRGRDLFYWLLQCGAFDAPRSAFLDPSGRVLVARPLMGSGHTVSLQSLSRMGIILLGRLTGSNRPDVFTVADDLLSNINFADQASCSFTDLADRYIEQVGASAPPPEPDPAEECKPILQDPPILSLDLRSRGIKSIVWCTGFKGDYSWVKVDGCIDTDGRPIQDDCVSPVPGLLFAGIDFGSTRRSGTMLAAERESQRIAQEILCLVGPPQNDYPPRQSLRSVDFAR
jgi:putative flavoprotein involved in K+ transport